MSNRTKMLLATSALPALSTLFAAPSYADKRSNILLAGLTNDVVTLDPAMGFSGNDYSVLYSIHDRLIHFDPKTNIVETHISRLRGKLSRAGREPELIHTVRGSGYILRLLGV